MLCDLSREASPKDERNIDHLRRGLFLCYAIFGLFLIFFCRVIEFTKRLSNIGTMAMKMKSFYKGFKCISQIFAMEKESDEIQIGYPTDVKHMAHIGWEGSSGSAPGWMTEFKVGAEVLSPRASSFGHTIPSTSFFTSSSTDVDQGSSRRTILETLKNLPPINLPKNNSKRSSRRKKSFSSSSSPKSSRASTLSKSSYKSTISQII